MTIAQHFCRWRGIVFTFSDCCILAALSMARDLFLIVLGLGIYGERKGIVVIRSAHHDHARRIRRF